MFQMEEATLRFLEENGFELRPYAHCSSPFLERGSSVSTPSEDVEERNEPARSAFDFLPMAW